MKHRAGKCTAVFPIVFLFLLPVLAQAASGLDSEKSPATEFPFKNGDRVAWIGSSSTRIGIWCKTLEFLIRTRHPELKITFARETTGGGTFGTGTQYLTTWLEEIKPTLVVFNYGGNDAAAGEGGIVKFEDNMQKCVQEAADTRARVLLVTPQSNDSRKAKPGAAEKRKLYAETMLSFGKQKGWTVIDTHHALEALQLNAQAENPAFTINKDHIHLNDPAYVAWGYFLFQRMDAPRETNAEITSEGKVVSTTRCRISDVRVKDGYVSFNRTDSIFPFMPPLPLPPRKYVPLEDMSPYLLKITGLPEGKYRITCDEVLVGNCNASELAAGVNMNSLLLNEQLTAPWSSLAAEIWAGVNVEKIGGTTFRFDVRKEGILPAYVPGPEPVPVKTGTIPTTPAPANPANK